jgi:hypothetical protein
LTKAGHEFRVSWCAQGSNRVKIVRVHFIASTTSCPVAKRLDGTLVVEVGSITNEMAKAKKRSDNNSLGTCSAEVFNKTSTKNITNRQEDTDDDNKRAQDKHQQQQLPVPI